MEGNSLRTVATTRVSLLETQLSHPRKLSLNLHSLMPAFLKVVYVHAPGIWPVTALICLSLAAYSVYIWNRSITMLAMHFKNVIVWPCLCASQRTISQSQSYSFIDSLTVNIVARQPQPKVSSHASYCFSTQTYRALLESLKVSLYLCETYLRHDNQ